MRTIAFCDAGCDGKATFAAVASLIFATIQRDRPKRQILKPLAILSRCRTPIHIPRATTRGICCVGPEATRDSSRDSVRNKRIIGRRCDTPRDSSLREDRAPFSENRESARSRGSDRSTPRRAKSDLLLLEQKSVAIKCLQINNLLLYPTSILPSVLLLRANPAAGELRKVAPRLARTCRMRRNASLEGSCPREKREGRWSRDESRKS